MATEVMLTTFDNPYDPFDEFIPWFLYDVEHGYYTCSRLARIARYSEDSSTIEDKLETERAINEIIDYDFLNIYKKVTRENPDKNIPVQEKMHEDSPEDVEEEVQENEKEKEQVEVKEKEE